MLTRCKNDVVHFYAGFIHRDSMTSCEFFYFAYSILPLGLFCTGWYNGTTTDCLTLLTCTQVAEFFLFSGLMFVTTFAFVIMSLFYKYVTPRSVDDDHDSMRKATQQCEETATASPAVTEM